MSIRTLSSRLVYENPWLSLREDHIERADCTPGIYSVVDVPNFAIVLPFEDNGFHLVEQYRYPTGERSWEFPAGSFPAGVTGTPEQLAAAELVEETGFRAAKLERVGFLHPANSMTGQGGDVFIATQLSPGPARREATEQDMRQQWFARTEFEQMVREGVITDGPTLAAYLLFTIRRQG
ncbi:NUDIX hydrolase [Nocardia sp. XZ_19_385]|uniref:NUDIX domain-containing protein n=1 Tax=Nocardia sp. XZ_19_385 TaxID=2769488 RepID=UPI00188F2ED6|nr:NUDIX hydrolase [Nocardia sp. XZ_19_385]